MPYVSLIFTEPDFATVAAELARQEVDVDDAAAAGAALAAALRDLAESRSYIGAGTDPSAPHVYGMPGFVLRRVMASLDGDGDGRISRADILAFFDRLDADQDGYVTGAELSEGLS